MATVLRDVSVLQMHIQPTVSGVNLPITQSATGLSGQTSSRQPHQGRGGKHPDRTRALRERRHREGNSRQEAASPGARPRGNTSRQDAAQGASARKQHLDERSQRLERKRNTSRQTQPERGRGGTHPDERSPQERGARNRRRPPRARREENSRQTQPGRRQGHASNPSRSPVQPSQLSDP